MEQNYNLENNLFSFFFQDQLKSALETYSKKKKNLAILHSLYKLIELLLLEIVFEYITFISSETGLPFFLVLLNI